MKMKYTISVMMLISLFCMHIQAQRLFNSKIAGLNVGIGNNEYGINPYYEKLFGMNKNSFVVDFLGTYRTQMVRTQEFKADILNADLGIGYRRYIEMDMTLYPFAGLGGRVGNEIFLNKSKMPETTFYERQFGLQYGGYVEIGFEYMFEEYGINVSVRPTYNFRNKEFITYGFIGLKYYIK